MTNGRTILAVDDDLKLLIALQKRFESIGYRVLLATNGSDALSRAREERIDVISLDVGLPGDVNGLSVAESLKKDPQTAGIPIIFITGEASDDFKRKCAAVGGKYFLAKPYDPDLLLQVVRGVFGEDELTEAQRISQAKRRQPV